MEIIALFALIVGYASSVLAISYVFIYSSVIITESFGFAVSDSLYWRECQERHRRYAPAGAEFHIDRP